MTFSPLVYIVGSLWLLGAAIDYAYFTYFAQLKEYRLDRFKDFVSTPAGKDVLFGFRILWRALIVVVLYTLLHGTLSNLHLITAIVGIDTAEKLYHIYKRTVRRPVITAKAVLIVGTLVGLEAVILAFFPYINILLLLFVMRWLVTALYIVLLMIPTELAKKMYILSATKKLARYPQLQVIGITGSYGKSSTKEFLFQILEKEFAVAKTPRNINTEIGVAKHILQTDFSNIRVYVVEMGAYRVSEIKKICDMVRPTIGILTAIGPQHLSLFGSMEHIKKAKAELLLALPPEGLGIINADNDLSRSLIPTLSCRVKTFGTEDIHQPDVLITDIEGSSTGMSYVVTTANSVHNVSINISGKHNVFNIIPAAMVARELGMSNDAIDAAIRDLKPGHGTIGIIPYGNATVLNDSYNSNPEGFKAALDMLNTFPSGRKRIVITRGMVELADKSEDLHEQIGGEISFVADELIITEKDFAEPLARGVVSKYRTEVRHLYAPQDVLLYLKQIKKTNAVILVENRVHEMIRKELHI